MRKPNSTMPDLPPAVLIRRRDGQEVFPGDYEDLPPEDLTYLVAAAQRLLQGLLAEKGYRQVKPHSGYTNPALSLRRVQFTPEDEAKVQRPPVRVEYMIGGFEPSIVKIARGKLGSSFSRVIPREDGHQREATLWTKCVEVKKRLDELDEE